MLIRTVSHKKDNNFSSADVPLDNNKIFLTTFITKSGPSQFPLWFLIYV